MIVRDAILARAPSTTSGPPHSRREAREKSEEAFARIVATKKRANTVRPYGCVDNSNRLHGFEYFLDLFHVAFALKVGFEVLHYAWNRFVV